ncbi:MAG: magnesium transporter [Zetaproteobacteria bacterium]|nr:MAG: magnesium transporter [Zetaproteobacteria bacterium]
MESLDTDQSSGKNTALPEEISTHLPDENIKEILDAAKLQDSDTVYAALKELSTADAAELISKIKEEDRQELLSMYGEALDPQVFVEMDQELSRATLATMPTTSVVEVISKLESDDALLLVETLKPNIQKEVIKRLSTKARLALEEGLSFPEDSAGRLMRRELVAIPEFWTVGKTIDYLRASSDALPEEFFDLFIINPSHHLTGAIPLSHLIRSERSEKIQNLQVEGMHSIPAEMDQEEVAHMFRRDNIVSAPVTDEDGRLIGMITIDDIVDVIDEEAQEDLLRMVGVGQGDLYRAVISTANTRFKWLFVNLLTAILASIVISFFGATIQQIVALAVLMPIVASMGGNAGTQALTVAVRAIATHEISETNTWRVIWKETLVGILNGVLFAVLTGFIAAFWFQSPILGVVIALAMTINLIVAGLFGASIPLFLHRIGSDPAVSSTVLLTTVTDVIGFLSFLGLATLLMT